MESEQREKKNQEKFQKVLDDQAYYGTGWEEKTLRELVETEKNERLKKDQDKQSNQIPPAGHPKDGHTGPWWKKKSKNDTIQVNDTSPRT